MSNSLRDQLLGLGYKPAPKPDRKPSAAPPGGHSKRGEGGKPHGGKPGAAASRRQPDKGRPGKGGGKESRSREEIDLAKAYAIRAQREKDERIEAERIKQENARVRREAKARLTEFLKDKALNDPAAEWVRHFPYGGKIKRVHVTEAQFRALNAGELGVVQDGGRYVVVTAATLAEAETIFPDAIALKVDPNAPVEADPYSDPQYQVPDDLIW